MAYPKYELSFTLMAALVVLVTMSCFWHGSMAQSSDCTNAIISMSSCLSYIQGNTSTPSSGCCSQLSSVVNTQPQCLCQVLNGGGSSLGLNINQTQALQLPKVCKVQTPPVSQCNNGKSPAGKAAPASPSTTVPSGKGSDSVPSSTDTNTSDATLKKAGASFFFLILFMASYISSFINS